MRLQRRTTSTAAAAKGRIVRRAVPKDNGKEEGKQIILDAFGELDTVDANIAVLAARKAELEDLIRSTFTEKHTGNVTDGRYTVLEEEVKSKGGRDIDAKVFFDTLAERGPDMEDAAWAAMNVTLKNAEKLLAPAELNKLFPPYPGVVTGTRVTIERVEVKATSGRRK